MDKPIEATPFLGQQFACPVCHHPFPYHPICGKTDISVAGLSTIQMYCCPWCTAHAMSREDFNQRLYDDLLSAMWQSVNLCAEGSPN